MATFASFQTAWFPQTERMKLFPLFDLRALSIFHEEGGGSSFSHALFAVYVSLSSTAEYNSSPHHILALGCSICAVVCLASSAQFRIP